MTEPANVVVEPLPGNFGARAEVADVSCLSDSALADLLGQLYKHRFLVLKTQGVSKDQYVEFARRIGDPIPLSRDASHPEIAVISNIDVDSKATRLGAAHWHTDQSFRNTVSSMTMLYSVQAPLTGGATKFCNMVAALAALPEDFQTELERYTVMHRHGVSVSAPPGDHTPLPPKGFMQSHTVFHPLVRKHPQTNEKTLYAVTGTAQGICAMPQDKATKLLTKLRQHVLQERFRASYRHEANDIVVWDNPTTMHSATPIAQATCDKDSRILLRISLRGETKL